MPGLRQRPRSVDGLDQPGNRQVAQRLRVLRRLAERESVRRRARAGLPDDRPWTARKVIARDEASTAVKGRGCRGR
jgi:uncharacterized membrane protein YcjF (UPF0283 family)